jgi:trimethylamine--corrinoid protein Co-methyltransferase
MNLNTRPLSDDELLSIHETSMQILGKVGIHVEGEEILKIFKKAGALVDFNEERVFLPLSLMNEILSNCFPHLTLYDTRGEKSIVFGEDQSHFGTHGFPSLYRDHVTGEIRSGKYSELIDFLKVADVLEYPQIVAPSLQPTDVDSKIADLLQAKAALVTTKKPLYLQAFSGQSVHDIVKMLTAVVGGEETLRQNPHSIFCVCTYSPLTIRQDAAEVLVESAKLGAPVYITSGAMGGATSPVTLSGELAQVNAEILSHVALSKIINPDAHVVYASSCRIFDMKFGVCASSTPEYALFRASTSQLGRHYNLPTGGGGLNTDSSTIDAQYGWEKFMTTLIPAMAGQNIILGMGIFSQMNSISIESLVVDYDIVKSVNRILDGVKVDEDRLAFEVIKNNAKTSDFMSDSHTMKYFKEEAWIPDGKITDRSAAIDWEMNGRKTTLNRARSMVDECLNEYKGPSIPEDTRQKLDDIIENRMK